MFPKGIRPQVLELLVHLPLHHGGQCWLFRTHCRVTRAG